jgi:hypothetical protein
MSALPGPKLKFLAPEPNFGVNFNDRLAEARRVRYNRSDLEGR